MNTPPPSPPWFATLSERARRYWLLKTLGVTVFTGIFFIGYAYLLRNPAYPVTVMPLTALDAMIPFQPQALLPYLSLWFYVGFGPGLQLTLRELIEYTLWVAAMCLAGLAAFYFWPTEVPPLALDRSRFWGFAMLEGVDGSGNACPSLHVAAALFSALWVEQVLRQLRTPLALRCLNAAWFAAIAYSTLAVKQHVVWDAVAGALLGTAFALPALYWRPAQRAARRHQRGYIAAPAR